MVYFILVEFMREVEEEFGVYSLKYNKWGIWFLEFDYSEVKRGG